MLKLLSTLLLISVYCQAEVEYHILPLSQAEGSFDLSMIRPSEGPNPNGQYLTMTYSRKYPFLYWGITLNDPNADQIKVPLSPPPVDKNIFGIGKVSLSDNGQYVTGTASGGYGFIWNSETGTQFIPSEHISPRAVNNNGDLIFHQLAKPEDGTAENFTVLRTNDGKTTFIKSSEKSFATNGEALNDHQQVVGYYRTMSPEKQLQHHAFVWDESRGFRELMDTIPANSGWSELKNAAHISNDGLIYGSGVFDGKSSDFLLVPISKQLSPKGDSF